MPLLPGEELLRHVGESLDPLARDVGTFLHRLHALTPPPDLPVDPMSRSDAARRGKLAQ